MIKKKKIFTLQLIFLTCFFIYSCSTSNSTSSVGPSLETTKNQYVEPIKTVESEPSWSNLIAHSMTYIEAIHFCEELEELGKTWKLPSIDEFEELSHNISSHIFKQPKFWTSTMVEESKDNAWLYDLSEKYKLGTDKEYPFSVICIEVL